MAPLTVLNEEALLQSSVRQFAREQIAPRVRAMDESATFDPKIQKGLFELGLMGVEVPEEYGGAGGTFFQSVLCVEEIAAVDPAVAVMVDVQNTLVVNALLRFGSDAQQAKWLPKLNENVVGAYALSEAGSGSDAFGLAMTAKAEGSEYVLDGRKLWISSAHEAGLFLVFATVDSAAGYKGITCFWCRGSVRG